MTENNFFVNASWMEETGNEILISEKHTGTTLKMTYKEAEEITDEIKELLIPEDEAELIKYAKKIYVPEDAKAYVEDCLSEGMTVEDIKECVDNLIEIDSGRDV